MIFKTLKLLTTNGTVEGGITLPPIIMLTGGIVIDTRNTTVRTHNEMMVFTRLNISL